MAELKIDPEPLREAAMRALATFAAEMHIGVAVGPTHAGELREATADAVDALTAHIVDVAIKTIEAKLEAKNG